MKNCQKGLTSIFIILIALVILGIAGAAYYFGKSSNSVPLFPASPTPSSTATPASTPTTSPTTTPSPSPSSKPIPTSNPNSNVFYSQDLGISFNYTTKSTGINDTKFSVKQIGNKVYVYSGSGPAENGQYLEMFTKDKNQSLIDAIKAKILTGYSLDDCLLKTITQTFTGQSYPANYELAQITVLVLANDDMETLSNKAKKCPATYTAVGGMSYFLMDKDHPDKFVFFSIGQYAIDSGIGDKYWQNTITFYP